MNATITDRDPDEGGEKEEEKDGGARQDQGLKHHCNHCTERQQCREPSQNKGPAFAIQYFNKRFRPEDLLEEE